MSQRSSHPESVITDVEPDSDRQAAAPPHRHAERGAGSMRPHTGRKRRQAVRRRRVARKSVAVLPTMFTLGNALCGFAAIFVASRAADTQMVFGWSPLLTASVFIFLGMAMDGLDGRIARLTRSMSDLGEQLDSMADMVTFGVAPAFLAVQLIGVDTPFLSDRGDIYFNRLAIVVAGIYVACAALRLARFNVEVQQGTEDADHMSFSGLPSPGAAGTVAALTLLHQHFLADERAAWVLNSAAVMMLVVMGLSAFAMVSRLRYVHVMNRYIRGRAPFGTIAKMVVLGMLMVVEPFGAVAAGFVVYALSAPSIYVYRRTMRRRAVNAAASS